LLVIPPIVERYLEIVDDVNVYDLIKPAFGIGKIGKNRGARPAHEIPRVQVEFETSLITEILPITKDDLHLEAIKWNSSILFSLIANSDEPVETLAKIVSALLLEKSIIAISAAAPFQPPTEK